jgi:hypothetical protein
MRYSSTGNYNIAIGYGAMNDAEEANYSIGIGRGALNNSISPGYNIAIGPYALMRAGGSYAIALGYNAGQYASGSGNIFMGGGAGRGGSSSTPYSTGIYNVAIGFESFYSHTTAANYNVFMGDAAGKALLTGDDNTGIGSKALFNILGSDSTAVLL